MIDELYKNLIQEAVNYGLSDPLSIYLYIDRKTTQQISNLSVKGQLLNITENTIYRDYFYLMLHIQNCYISILKEDIRSSNVYIKLQRKLDYLSLMCGILNLRNLELNKQVSLYCKYKAKFWNLIDTNKVTPSLDIVPF